jgi:hypothetical protein
MTCEAVNHHFLARFFTGVRLNAQRVTSWAVIGLYDSAIESSRQALHDYANIFYTEPL